MPSEVGRKNTPPMPDPAASQAPTTLGLDRTNLAIQVGWEEMSLANQQKLLRNSKSFLQEGEKATGPQDGNGHGTEFSKDFVPCFSGNQLLSRCDIVEDLLEALFVMRGGLNGPLQGVDDPPQHSFPGVPSCVAFP